MLVAAAVVIEPADRAQQMWFVATLVASLAGDVLLMLPRERFLGGLGAFLLAHLAYIGGFIARGGELGYRRGLLAVALIALPLAGRIARGAQAHQPALLAPVAVHMTVTSVIVVVAAATGIALAVVGAELFLASDALIAWTRFVRPLAWAPVAIIAAYHLGQAGLVLSLR